MTDINLDFNTGPYDEGYCDGYFSKPARQLFERPEDKDEYCAGYSAGHKDANKDIESHVSFAYSGSGVRIGK